MTDKTVILYSLSTCAFCKAIEKMLGDLAVNHKCIQADELPAEERKRVMRQLRTINPSCSFPTIVVGGEVVVGYKVQEIKEKIGIRTETDDLFDRLKKVNEPKGYFFNRNKEKTFELLRSLLINKERYGYMGCPCRLASGNRESDRDIICPCDYRKPDIEEYGSCFCGLYVSRRWNNGELEHRDVPERRPPEKYFDE